MLEQSRQSSSRPVMASTQFERETSRPSEKMPISSLENSENSLSHSLTKQPSMSSSTSSYKRWSPLKASTSLPNEDSSSQHEATSFEECWKSSPTRTLLTSMITQKIHRSSLIILRKSLPQMKKARMLNLSQLWLTETLWDLMKTLPNSSCPKKIWWILISKLVYPN